MTGPLSARGGEKTSGNDVAAGGSNGMIRKKWKRVNEEKGMGGRWGGKKAIFMEEENAGEVKEVMTE